MSRRLKFFEARLWDEKHKKLDSSQHYRNFSLSMRRNVVDFEHLVVRFGPDLNILEPSSGCAVAGPNRVDVLPKK